MGDGLKRVAKQCGGLTAIGLDGRVVKYDADGERIPPKPYRTRGVRNVRVIGEAGTNPAIVNLIRSYARRLAKVSAPTKRITILVVPAPVVTGGDGGVGFGMFFVGADDVNPVPTIWIPGERVDEITHNEWAAEMLPQTLAHEWAHYEQWRDGRPVQERGVVVRARNLVRLAGIP